MSPHTSCYLTVTYLTVVPEVTKVVSCAILIQAPLVMETGSAKA